MAAIFDYGLPQLRPALLLLLLSAMYCVTYFSCGGLRAGNTNGGAFRFGFNLSRRSDNQTSTAAHKRQARLQLPEGDAAAVLRAYFPQTQQCGSEKWRVQYAKLHNDIVSGKSPPRYLISVAVQEGMADRITGVVTQLYLAMLSQRALTMVTYDDLPPFESACSMPYINFTQPEHLPAAAVDPAKSLYAGLHTIPSSGSVNNSIYDILFLYNQDQHLGFFKTANLSIMPPGNPDVPYLLSSNNRGQTYHIMHNNYHRQQLAGYGLSPDTGFMCGWFFLCAPNRAVQRLYSRFWDVLSEKGTLKIGINVRLGDAMFTQQNMSLGEAQLASAAPYFTCAERLEKAFATPGQKVIYYLISDSVALRAAAQEKYGQKLLVDAQTVTKHPDCRRHNPEACNKDAMDLAIQHSLGQLLTFSLADFHIYTQGSGYGRLGAWLSGKYDNLFELDDSPLDVTCNPAQPITHAVSSGRWSQI